MIVKYEFIEKYIVNIPKDSHWEIYMSMFDEKGFEMYELCLYANGKEYIMSNAEIWCTGRNIPESQIGCLHEDVIDKIFEHVSNNPDQQCIDIDKIIDELITKEYKDHWLDKKYIELSLDGSW